MLLSIPTLEEPLSGWEIDYTQAPPGEADRCAEEDSRLAKVAFDMLKHRNKEESSMTAFRSVISLLKYYYKNRGHRLIVSSLDDDMTLVFKWEPREN